MLQNADIAFTPITIGNLDIKNRFLMSAVVDGLVQDIDARIKRFSNLANGGIGLIISGRVMDKEESFGKVVEAVHQAGGKVGLQLVSHVGLGFDKNADTPAASVVPRESKIFSDYFFYSQHHAASEAEITEIISGFASCARLAKSFGVDAVQVHSAHSSALMQFLTPLINQRKDQWGGSIQNRVRLHQEVYRAIRREVGDTLPILIKLGVKDPYPDGLSLQEGVMAAKILAETGYDALEISQGLQDFSDLKTWKGTPMHMFVNNLSSEGYFREFCRQVKQVVNKPCITTGGNRSYELIDDILKSGEADLVGICRPLIKEPDLVKRWQSGDRKRAKCISCNKCGIALAKSLPLACYAAPASAVAPK